MIHVSGFDLSHEEHWNSWRGAERPGCAAEPCSRRWWNWWNDEEFDQTISDPSARILFFDVFCLFFSSHGGRFVFFLNSWWRKIHLRWRTVAVMACAKRWILAAVVGWPNLGWVLWYLTDLYSNLGKDRKVDDDYILVGIYQILSFLAGTLILLLSQLMVCNSIIGAVMILLFCWIRQCFVVQMGI